MQAESLYEAVVLAVRAFRADPWLERFGPNTLLDVQVREPTTKHAISLQQVERWLGDGAIRESVLIKQDGRQWRVPIAPDAVFVLSSFSGKSAGRICGLLEADTG